MPGTMLIQVPFNKEVGLIAAASEDGQPDVVTTDWLVDNPDIYVGADDPAEPDVKWFGTMVLGAKGIVTANCTDADGHKGSDTVNLEFVSSGEVAVLISQAKLRDKVPPTAKPKP